MKIAYSQAFFPRPATAGDLLVRDASGEVVFHVPDRSPQAIRARIWALKDSLLAAPEHAEMPVNHTLIDGVYTRSLFIAKGTLLVGKIHLKECVNIVAKGDISILTEGGSGRFQAGHVAVSAPGIQKLGYAHEDTVFINVFRTDETDIDKIEAEIASEEFTALAAEKKETLCL
jgi:hypothetical protein